jgi:hypothetical protein
MNSLYHTFFLAIVCFGGYLYAGLPPAAMSEAAETGPGTLSTQSKEQTTEPTSKKSVSQTKPAQHNDTAPGTLAPGPGTWSLPPMIQSVSGCFYGRIFSGDDMDSIKTFLQYTTDGAIVGEYVIYEENEEVEGRLVRLLPVSQYVFRGKWEDAFGEGPVRLLFTSQFDAFTGYWGPHPDSIFAPIYGSKERWQERFRGPVTYYSIFSFEGLKIFFTEVVPSLWKPKREQP